MKIQVMWQTQKHEQHTVLLYKEYSQDDYSNDDGWWLTMTNITQLLLKKRFNFGFLLYKIYKNLNI